MSHSSTMGKQSSSSDTTGENSTGKAACTVDDINMLNPPEQTISTGINTSMAV